MEEVDAKLYAVGSSNRGCMLGVAIAECPPLDSSNWAAESLIHIMNTLQLKLERFYLQNFVTIYYNRKVEINSVRLTLQLQGIRVFLAHTTSNICSSSANF